MSDKDNDKVLFCWKCKSKKHLRWYDTLCGYELYCNHCETVTRWEQDEDSKEWKMIPSQKCDLCDNVSINSVGYGGHGVFKNIKRCHDHPISKKEKDALFAQWKKEVKEKQEQEKKQES